MHVPMIAVIQSIRSVNRGRRDQQREHVVKEKTRSEDSAAAAIAEAVRKIRKIRLPQQAERADMSDENGAATYEAKCLVILRSVFDSSTPKCE